MKSWKFCINLKCKWFSLDLQQMIQVTSLCVINKVCAIGLSALLAFLRVNMHLYIYKVIKNSVQSQRWKWSFEIHNKLSVTMLSVSTKLSSRKGLSAFSPRLVYMFKIIENTVQNQRQSDPLRFTANYKSDKLRLFVATKTLTLVGYLSFHWG